MDFNENRKCERYNIVPQFVEVKEFSRKSVNFITNISQSGIRIHSTEDIERKNQSLITTIPLPKKNYEREFLTLQVYCTWNDLSTETAYSKIGCRFLNITEEQKESLQQMIDFYKAKS